MAKGRVNSKQTTCLLPRCKNTDGLIGGYCSDTCLQNDMAPDDLPPVTICAPNKSGGFGRDLSRTTRQPVHLPRRSS